MMSLQAEIVEPVTLAPNFENGMYRRAEDSGYNSVTPGSIECSEMSNENIDPVIACNTVPEANKRDRRCKRFKCASVVAFNGQQSPMKRRALKRPYQEDANTSDLSFNSIPTPTSIIAKRIQRLGVDDDFDVSVTQTSFNTEYSGSISMETYSCAISNPTTPVKSCPLRTIHNLCSVRRSPKKLNFAGHSLPGELQFSQEKQPLSTAKTTFRPDQKVDIINMLYFKVCNMPALKKIFGYLTDEDVYNYSKINSTCLQICRQVPEARMKKDNYKIYKTITKENNENKNIVRVSEIIQGEEFGKDLGPSLKDIHNIVNGHLAKPSPKRSPPTTPKTRRFKTYTKSASFDSRVQLSCVRCRQPAKVTEEANGEEWVECTSVSCCYQFCRFCRCERHPNKTCFRFDLEGPSPSKRKKKVSVIGTKKSKKNLQRLLL